MNPQEQTLIEDLFARIRSNGVSGRDAEADQLIGRQMTGTPGAAYALVQTVIVQDQALKAASARIQALEAAQSQRGNEPEGSFLGAAASQQSHWSRPTAAPPASPGGAPAQPAAPQQNERGGGGGFLQGALQTAAGVAGGALLFDGIRSLLGGGLGGIGSGFGGGPWAAQPPVVEETVINNYENGDTGNAGDANSDNDPGIINADWSPDDNTADDDIPDDGGDDSSWA